jgi:DNA-directed RNA polymerase subunit RPC12/RpoP
VQRGGETSPIFDSVGTRPADGAIASGEMPGEGTYFCVVCGRQVALRETDELPHCDHCGSAHFRRDSIFSSLQEHGSPTLEFAVAGDRVKPGWLEEARRQLKQPGYHLVTRERGEVLSFRLKPGWSRIGRCRTAAICLDDPSVSRRHAILVADPGKPPRILDDRSLNGVLVNGKKTEMAELEAGDELAIGRYRLYVLHS